MTSELPRFEPPAPDRDPPALTSPRGALPLRAVAVRAQIAGATADVEVEQTFDNVFDEALEVSYVFPLPDLAAVTRCELRVGGRVVAARLEERGAAREAYAQAAEAGRRAALAEQERPGVFTITLGALPPGERASVRLAMAYLLPREDGRHVFRFPLVVGERYVPGAPLPGAPVGAGTEADTARVTDASRISPPRLAPGAERPELSIEVALVHGALGACELESSLHAVHERRGGDRTIVRLAPGERMDRDFVLRFRLGADDGVRSQLVTCDDPGPAPERGGAAGGEATFQLTLVPPAARLRSRPRDLVLLLDRSGSMDGWKIVAARRALARMVDVLDDGDRFAVYAFGSETVACADLAVDRLHDATAAHRARAVEMLSGMSAAGGTEMRQPLELAAGLLAGDPTRDRWIVLVTDGQVANEDELVAVVAQAPEVKVLGLGIDDAVNASLLRRLAAATGGRVELVQREAELEDALDRLHVSIAVPVIERVTVEADAVVPGTLVPAGPLHVFPGVPLIVRGRCRGPLPAVRVRGRIGREPFEATVRGERADLPGLRACWAREHLLALEDRFAAERGERRAALADDVIATSLGFGVLCRFTAFVAVDEQGPVAAAPSRSVQQPVEATLPAIAPRSTIPATRWGPGAPARNSRTMAGTLRGKLGHLTPEQARGLPIGPPHEVHGVARLLWEMLAGRPLFRGDSDFETLTAIVQGALPSPLVPEELAHLEPILRRALAIDPARRHATPGELAAALEAAAPALAAPAEIAAWLAALDPPRLDHQAALLARAAAAHPPARGYLVLAQLEIAGDADRYLAVRAGPRGNQPALLERLRADLAEDPELVELFLSEAALAIEGLVRIDDAGVDSLGGVFRAQPFVPGLDLQHVLRTLARAHAAVPAPIALAIACAAARALEAALRLPGGAVGLIPRDLSPRALRIAADGRPIWTALGVAPRADLTAPRRWPVPIAAAPPVTLDAAGRAAAPTLAPHVSRFVVVPRTTRAQPPAPAPPRHRWWRD